LCAKQQFQVPGFKFQVSGNTNSGKALQPVT